MLAQAGDWREQGLGSALLAGLERRLTARGIQRISALLPHRTGKIPRKHPTPRRCSLRPPGDRQNDFRQSRGVTAGLALR